MALISRKQFDLSHIHIDEKLQGASLASFTRRSAAFLVDWTIIFICTEYLWILVPLGLVYLLGKGKLKKSVTSGSRYIKKSVILADRKLETLDIDEKLRKRFRKSITFYLHMVIYLPVVAALIIFVVWLVKLIFPQEFSTTAVQTSSFLSTLFQPVTDLNDALALISKFFGAFLYFSFFTWKWLGQTPGKRFMKIRAVKLNGQPISLWGSMERTTGYTASAALFLVGFFQYFWDKNRQTTHDKITETIVIDC